MTRAHFALSSPLSARIDIYFEQGIGTESLYARPQWARHGRQSAQPKSASYRQPGRAAYGARLQATSCPAAHSSRRGPCHFHAYTKYHKRIVGAVLTLMTPRYKMAGRQQAAAPMTIITRLFR